MSYEIERYHPDLKSKVIKLQTHLWSANLALNTSYFEWKYEKNPYRAEPLIYLALHNGEPSGMRGFSGVQWQCGRPVQRFSGLYADDMVIAPEHRGRGLMAKIMTAAFKGLQTSGYDYIFNLSAGYVTLLSSIQLGWRNAGWLAPMCRPASISSQLLRRIMRVRGNIARLSAAPPQRWLTEIDLVKAQTLLQRTPQISLEDLPRCLDMSDLIERIGHTGRISHVRNTEYFQWRFQNPLSRYRFLFWQEHRLEGYIVLQEYTSERDLRDAVNIVDWEASHPSIKERLLEAVLSVFAGAPIVIWSAGLGRQETEMLRKNRFQLPNPPRDPIRSPPAILVRPVKHSPSEDNWKLSDLSLLALDSWDIRMLYSMAG